MTALTWIPILLAVSAFFVGLAILWFKSFLLYPFETTLKAAFAVLALLCGSFVAPKYDGTATLSFDLSPVLRIQGQPIRVYSGDQWIDWVIPFVTMGVLAAICLFRIRVKP
jgi:hypothetical protein